MSPAGRGFALSAAAAAVVLLLSLQLAAGVPRVQNHAEHRRRGISTSTAAAGGGSGACAVAVAPLGYPCEEHEVTTQDGYILSLQRIPKGRTGAGGGVRQPVLLQHGVLVDGMLWLLGSPEESLPYILADRGFDVWIANNRGTRWSRRHVSLHPSSRSYWDWSWDELVVNDMPAIVDYVSSHTGQKPHYVGHSMGTLVALAAFSQGMMVDKLKSAAMLSPVAYLSHITTPIGNALARSFTGELQVVSDVLGNPEFDPASPQMSNLVRDTCRKPGMNCYDLLTSVTGENYCLNSSADDIFLKYEPQLTSTKTMAHLAQMVRDGVLTKYDYVRPDVNVARYGQADPPAYNMSAIPAWFPLFLSSGGRDSLSDPADVGLLLDDLRGHAGDRLTVQYLQQFAHADFVIGVCAKDFVYNDVISFFHRFR